MLLHPALVCGGQHGPLTPPVPFEGEGSLSDITRDSEAHKSRELCTRPAFCTKILFPMNPLSKFMFPFKFTGDFVSMLYGCLRQYAAVERKQNQFFRWKEHYGREVANSPVRYVNSSVYFLVNASFL